MSNEIVVTTEQSFSSYDKIRELSKVLYDNPIYKKLGADAIYLMVSYAISLGIEPLEALNGGLYLINGKIGMAAETMARLVRKAGHSITKDPKSDNTICILHGKRADNGDTWTSTFSIEDAKRAGIYKSPWEKYPAAMCYNRAMAFLFRQLFPDVAKNAGYDKTELEEIEENEKKKIAKEREKTIEVSAIEGLSQEKQDELARIQLEFPDLIHNAKESLKKILKVTDDIQLKDFPEGYCNTIISNAKVIRENKKSHTEKDFEEEIIKEYV